MTAFTIPDEEELYLLAILDGADGGIDLAEFTWLDEENDDGCYRAWDCQWPWYTCQDSLQADQCARSVGKTVGIQMRAYSFVFNHAGQELLVTAPELNHLRPLTDGIEARLLGSRLAREMLPNAKGKGIARQPHWQARLTNGAKIVSRLPNKDGKGVKGQHPLQLELDEAQDYPLAGWVELIETLKRGSVSARWHCHGVPRGVRDKFYEITQDDSDFRVHRIMAMHRPSWSAQERGEKIKTYGGSRQGPDYKRNIYGEHGDATNPVFVLARLMATIDTDEGSEYNADVYAKLDITYEQFVAAIGSAATDDEHAARAALAPFLDLPGSHKAGHALAPKGYSAYYGGMDVGLTNHPSEILIFGERVGPKHHLDLLTRVHLQRIESHHQELVVELLFAFYGPKLKALALDRTGLGFPLYQALHRRPGISQRVYGYNASENVIVGFEDRELEIGETQEDLAIWRNVVEHATDVLRNDYVDPRRLTLPFDRELLSEWQGQNYTVVKSAQSPYGRRSYSQGKFHTLDAGKMMAAGKTLPLLEEMAKAHTQEPVFEAFVGAM